MEGFRQNPKMKSQIACFKEGGSTTPAKREAKCDTKADKADKAEDKKIAKKAVAQHEGAKHKGEEKTELKLKDGGRAKKDKPSVKRYDSKAIKMKKDASDKKAIAKTKKTKPVVERMSPAPAAPAPEGMGMPMESTDDMGIQGFADGRQIPQMTPGMAAYMPQQMPNARSVRQMGPLTEDQEIIFGRKRVPDTERTLALRRAVGMGAGMPGAGMGMGAGMPGAGMGMGAGMPGAGAMGGMGSMSDQERAILQGLQAVGSYCSGGKA